MVTTTDLSTVTMGELISHTNAEDLALIANPRWGGWSYDPEMYLTLRDEDDRDLYEIHLPRCTTSAAMLDIVMQVSLKTWCRPQHLADLLAALSAYAPCPSAEGRDPRR